MAEKLLYWPVTTDPGRPYVNEPGQPWRQYIFAAIANITVLASGFVLGWTSPINPKLRDPELSPLPNPISSDEEAWIGSLLTVGAMCGPFIGSPIATKLGRKWALVSTSIPLLGGFILITVAKSVGYLYAGRVLWGLATGMIFTISPMYCVEIATLGARGALGSFIALFITLGFVLIYAVGPFVSYYAVSYVGFGTVAAFGFFFFMPESPKFHLMNNNRDAAAASLMSLRGRSRAGVEAELVEMTAEIHASQDKTATLADVFKGGNLKAFLLSCSLLFFQQFSGINAVLFYMMNIFAASGSKMDAGIAQVIVGVIQVVASLITSFAVVDRFGRKTLMLVSTTGAAIGLGGLGLYFLLDQLKYPIVEKMGLVPIVSLVVFIIAYSLGLGPIPWAMMSELLPIEVKAVASPIGTTFSWVLTFIVTRLFGPIGAAAGMHVVFWLFGVCCILGFIFTVFVLPETRGKTALEIEETLAGRSSSSH